MERDKYSLVMDGKRLFFIETDYEAVAYLNSNRLQNAFSLLHAVQEVLAFGELRGYTLLTEKALYLLKNSISSQSKIGDWSFSVRDGESEITIEATFLTLYQEPKSSEVIRSKRFVFTFKKNGKMIIHKIEDSGSVGGFARKAPVPERPQAS